MIQFSAGGRLIVIIKKKKERNNEKRTVRKVKENDYFERGGERPAYVKMEEGEQTCHSVVAQKQLFPPFPQKHNSLWSLFNCRSALRVAWTNTLEASPRNIHLALSLPL